MADPAPAPAPPQTSSAPPASLGPESWYDRITRRKFVVNVGWGIFGVYIAGALGATLRFMFPNVLYEPPSTFKVGRPEDYTVGTVSEKWLKEYRTWVIRNQKGIYAVWARCTHLGCTPRWFSNENRFRCPCHGSNYNIEADVIAGPAPKPMYRCKIWLDDDGIINVDKGVGVILSTTDPVKRTKEPYFLEYA